MLAENYRALSLMKRMGFTLTYSDDGTVEASLNLKGNAPPAVPPADQPLRPPDEEELAPPSSAPAEIEKRAPVAGKVAGAVPKSATPPR
jgi:hypothetical protein